ncbi:hypothetical protein M3664_04560 [Paenibacillus lautus]|uniref:hypothetical protein n=1 Tax=Paenibacillus lautus TaxID=1401 RepID=UPI00203E98AF|nr:hypothetical protein [Paenibacillus lautus]MCM3257053.1 hypothetical protein [Paenibacillus lautus]
MNGEYALRLMKDELRDKKHEVDQYEQRQDNVMARTITKMKHQIYDLEFAIELLEEYQD